MQVEYEDQPPAEGSNAPHSEEENDESAEPTKKKRVIKSRQSLAEKKTGTTIFPMARVKRIIKADKELDMMSNEATFLIAVATEYFVKHFMEEGYTKARLEKRRIVNYKDMANVVSRSDEFDFLKDVIPMPVPISEALERRKAKLAADESAMMHDEEPQRSAPVVASAGPGEGEESPEAPARPEDSVDLDNVPEDLPPLAPSTNPLFPNAVVKRPPNTHARTAMPQQPKPAPTPPAPHRVPLTGKNAPSTPHSLTTRSSRRSINAQRDTPHEDPADDAMHVD